jgi:hypothetical protein
MASNGERMVVFDAEGGGLTTMAGVRYSKAPYIDLLLKAPDLFLIVWRILFASLDNLLNTLALDLNSVQVFVGSQKLGLHDLQL